MTNEKIAKAGKEFEAEFRKFLMTNEFNDHEAIIFTRMASRFLANWSDAMAKNLNLRVEVVDNDDREEE